MPVQAYLQLGQSGPIELPLPEDAQFVASEPAASDNVTDVALAVAESLDAPVGFPPLRQATVPGDRVAIALGEGVREPAQVVLGVVTALQRAGIERSDVRVVVGSEAEIESLAPQLTELWSDGAKIVAHDPHDENTLCYVAAVEDQPLRMNRELFDADVVLPVACTRLDQARDARGPFESLYPRFADAATIRRFSQGDSLDNPASVVHRRKETEQAGWLLGAPLVLEIVPGRGGGVAAVVAGAPADAARNAAEFCQREWQVPIEQHVDLVVTSITGGPEEQTWANVARALFAARRGTGEAQGAVAVCTQLNQPPGEALQKLMAARDDLDQATDLGRETSDDAATAWELYKALHAGPVYFMSQLDDDTVEDLGLAPLASTDEIARLASRSGACLIMNEGQHAVPFLAPRNQPSS